MGYTTEFSGQFRVDPPFTPMEVDSINTMANTRHDPPGNYPGIWCDWEVSQDGAYIEWNGTEKFYNYVEWLQYIINKYAKPTGKTVHGSVNYYGQDDGDHGVIICDNNNVILSH